MEATLSATTPLAERAKVLVPLLDTHAPYGDEHSLLAPEVVDAYNEAGLLKMWVPEELGGFELGPLRLARGAGAHGLRRSVGGLGADGGIAGDRHGRLVPRRDRDQGAVRQRPLPGHRRPGDGPRPGQDGRRRLPADRVVELRVGTPPR